MFCGELPCQCDGVKKKKVAKPKVVKPPTPTTTSTSPAPPRFKQKDRDLSLESALRNIREIVCEEDRIAIDQELRYTDPPDVKQLEAEWRAKHGSKKSQ